MFIIFTYGENYVQMSQALARYAASELGPTAMDIGIAVGKSLGSAALASGKRAIEGRRKTRAKKAVAKKFKMNTVGDNVGTSNSKWDLLELPYTNLSPQVLTQIALLDIVKFAGSAAYDRRLKDQVNFRGIKFCMNVRAEGALGTAKAMFNMAIISPKSDLTSSAAVPVTDFFRNPDGNDRGIDFGDASLSTLDYYCTAINTDKYNIHMRKKFLVGPSGSTEGNKERLVEFYLPINRQIRYEPGSANPVGKNMYFVWWFSASDGGAPANSVRYSYRIVKYFKETTGL